MLTRTAELYFGLQGPFMRLPSTVFMLSIFAVVEFVSRNSGKSLQLIYSGLIFGMLAVYYSRKDFSQPSD